MSFGLGIIGAGGIARVHAEAAVKAGQSIAGFCDIDETRARRLASMFAGAIATASVDEMLAIKDMPAVVVAVPNHLHASLAIRAMQAGKDVLLEKPMATSVADCDRIIEVMRRTNRMLQVNFVSRCAPAAVAARDLISAGRLGRIYHAKAAIYRRRGIPGLGRWFTTRAQSGGGVLIDLGVHLIDLILHLTDRPRVTAVSASCSSALGRPISSYKFLDMWAGPPDPKGTFDVEDAATALLRFEGGMTFELNVMWAANLSEDLHPSGVLLLGDKGGLDLDVWTKRLSLASEQEGRLVDVRPLLLNVEPWPAAWQLQHEHFARAVTRQAPPPATGQHGREVQAIVEALYRSNEESREVTLPS